MKRNAAPPTVQGLKEYAVRLLAGRGLSIGELKAKLRKRGGNEAQVETVVENLRDIGFLNDQRMAENFAAASKETRGFGRQRVMADLLKRKVAGPVAQKAVADAFAGADEAAMIKDYLERKYRGKDLAAFLSEEKHLASAYRRLRLAGFSSGASIRVLKRYAAQAEELEGMEE